MNTTKKHKLPFLGFLKVIAIILAIIILIIVGWMAFSAIDRVDPLKTVPSGFSLYVRTDSVWASIEPLLDLKVADIILSDETFGDLRETLLNLRSSDLRKSFLFNLVASRRVEAAMYDDDSFLAVVDLGFLSSVTRLLPYLYDYIKIPGLEKAPETSIVPYYTYTFENSVYYIFLHKNLAVVSPSLFLIEEASTLGTGSLYRNSDLELLTKPMTQPFRITADSERLIELFGTDNPILHGVLSRLSFEGLSTISFGVSDEHIGVDIQIPATINSETDPKLYELFDIPSEVPRCISLMPDSAQYYTLLSFGTLKQLLDGFMPVFPSSMGIPSMLKTGASLSKSILGLSLDDLLFSWSGDEMVAIGLEGKKDPVFVIKVADETKRKEVFKKLVSNILINENQSLFLDGVRLPQLQLPPFLQGLLSAFGIEIPKPYYMVEKGYIFFSESAENLSNISHGMRGSSKLVKTEMWNKVSKNQKNDSEISLFYNLSRSVPFFLRSNGIVSDILQQYGIGRLDIKLTNGMIGIQLEAESLPYSGLHTVPGYPIKVSGSLSPVLCKDPNSSVFYRLENNRTIKGFNPLNSQSCSFELGTNGWISQSITKDALWATTKEGLVYCFDETLSVKEGFPVLTGAKPNFQPVVTENGLIFADSDSVVYCVAPGGLLSSYTMEHDGDLVSSPYVNGAYQAWYSKSFEGEVFLYKNNQLLSGSWPVEVASEFGNGLGFGSPCLLQRGRSFYTGFVTQNGIFSVWNQEGLLVENFPVDLKANFHINFVSMGDCFYGLSDDGSLFKIDPFEIEDKRIVSIAIPNLTGKIGYLTTIDYDKDGYKELFVSGEGNILYGFDSKLELLQNFPVVGWGVPVFIDLNGDKKDECVVPGLDGTIQAWKIR